MIFFLTNSFYIALLSYSEQILLQRVAQLRPLPQRLTAMPTSFHRCTIFAPIGVLLALTACSKHNDASPEPPVVASWIIDGQERTSILARAEVSNDEVDVYIYQNFAGPSSKGSTVTVTLFAPKRVGTYVIGPSSQARASFTHLDTSTGNNRDSYSAEGGSITISTLTATTISGTFNLTGKGYLNKQSTKSLTGGKFKALL
ncbi:DUF6252 family protein [Hymenobacter rubripertinctus]|uniref:Uncharacterized protein n=1 Tax=Hymenobacter rubripertinctus TaxID=2029981 RepID=A0A418RAJ8_9BACT|nr:DUF6252 family protein [Hymenobacter rubripertinctus]RIY14302.1 hypothetical protein D0T11_01045 [Hymenobacter rubripertinctus]